MVPLMSESMDRRLRLLERTKLKLHFLVCSWCRRYLDQITFIRSAITRSNGVERETAGLSREARERLTRLLKDSW